MRCWLRVWGLKVMPVEHIFAVGVDGRGAFGYHGLLNGSRCRLRGLLWRNFTGFHFLPMLFGGDLKGCRSQEGWFWTNPVAEIPFCVERQGNCSWEPEDGRVWGAGAAVSGLSLSSSSKEKTGIGTALAVFRIQIVKFDTMSGLQPRAFDFVRDITRSL